MNLKIVVFKGVEWINVARVGDKWRDVVERVNDNMAAYNSGYFLTS